jgi:ABC-type glutathione transport system ATPase component
MEPVASINLISTGGSRTPGWQVQLRVDYVVTNVMQSHRGQSEEEVKQAIQEQLRSVGVVPNGRQIAQYATAISQLPPLPPSKPR